MLICFPVSVLKGKSQYYPPSAPGLSEIFGMFHASTLQHSKDLGSLQDCHGTVRVVFASVAMGMGIDLHGVNTIIHYGAPISIEDLLKTISKLVVEEGKWRFSLLHSLIDT